MKTCIQTTGCSLPAFACLLILTTFCWPNPVAAATHSSRPVTHVVLAGHRFNVEIADTDATRERGLMFRTHLTANQGMLFIYPDAQVRVFWMKNTLIPLDILFFDAQRRLVNISANTPPCKVTDCPTYASTAPARYVLELKAGTTRKLGIKPGALLSIAP